MLKFCFSRIGVWRSLVSRLVRDQEAGSSSLPTPTRKEQPIQAAFFNVSGTLVHLLFIMSFFKKKLPVSVDRAPFGPVEYIIVGLGNPGSRYEPTRHNCGFRAVDRLADKESFRISRLKFKSLTGEVMIGGHRCLVMKPQTYMNLSGEAVSEAAGFYKIPPEHIIVISDDINLKAGKLRIRRSGSAGGHNGLKSIILLLNSDEFPRVRIGVGINTPGSDLKDHVLGGFNDEDGKAVDNATDDAVDAVCRIVRGDIEGAMAKYN